MFARVTAVIASISCAGIMPCGSASIQRGENNIVEQCVPACCAYSGFHSRVGRAPPNQSFSGTGAGAFLGLDGYGCKFRRSLTWLSGYG